VTVLDTTPPVITCSSNKTVNCGTNWSFNTPSAHDACTGTNVPVSVQSAFTNGLCPQVATCVWIAYNLCTNASATCTQVVTVLDTTPPVITCSSNKTVNCGTNWSFNTPSAHDACTGTNVPVSVQSAFTNGLCPQVATCVWIAYNLCTNASATCTQVVTVVNTNPPVILCPSNIVVASCVATQVFYTVTASNLCCTNVPVVCTPTNGSYFAPNTTNWVTCYATDCCSNTASCSFPVTVEWATNCCCPCLSNILVNGNFENEPNFGNGVVNSPYVSALTGSQIPGWTIATSHAATIHSCCSPLAFTISGQYSLNTDGEGYDGNNALVYQDFSSAAGQVYNLSFDWVSWDPYSYDFAHLPATELEVSVTNTGTSAKLFDQLYAYNASAQQQVQHVATSFTGTGGTLRLQIQETPQSGVNDNLFVVDNFCISLSTNCCVPAPANLVLWLPFDETTGPTSANLASPANPGTQFGGPGVVPGVVGNALSFDGVDQYVTVPDYPALEIGTNDLTIDAWVNRATNGPDSGPSVIVDKRDVNTYAGYSLSVSYGKLVFNTAYTDYEDTGYYRVPHDGLWHFVAVSVSQSAGQVSFYIDGALNSTQGLTPSDLANTSPLWVGASPLSGNRPWTGDLDEVEVYNRALLASELQTIFYAGPAGKCKTNCVGTLTLLCSNLTIACGSAVPTNPPAWTDPCCSNVTVTLLSSTVISNACSQTNYQTWEAVDHCYGTSNTCVRVVTVVNTNPPILNTTTVAYPMVAYSFAGTLACPVGSSPAGTPFTGSFSYDASLSNQSPNPNAYGEYVPASMSLAFGSTTVTVNNQGNIYVYGPPTSQADIFLLDVDNLNVSIGGGSFLTDLSLNLEDVTGMAWQGTALPGPGLTMANLTPDQTFIMLTYYTLGTNGIYGLNVVGYCDSALTNLSCSCGTNKTFECGTPWAFDTPVFQDACSGTNLIPIIVSTVTNGVCTLLITRTWEATDGCSNSSFCSQTVTVVNTNPPVLTCATNKTVQCGSGWTFDPPSASDLCCTNLTYTLLSSNGTPVSPCVTLYAGVWQATDCCSNSSVCTQLVTEVKTGPQGTNTGITLDYATVPDAGISFAAGGSFTFVGNANGLQFQIDDVFDGFGDSLGFSGYFSSASPFTIGNITVYGPAQKAQVTGSGTLHITDGANDELMGTISWVDITTLGTSGVLNLNGRVNLTKITYAGASLDLQALVASGTAQVDLTFQFIPALTLTQLAATGGFSDYSGTIQGSPVVTNLPLITCATNKTVPCGATWTFDPPVPSSACCTNLTIIPLLTLTNGSACGQVISQVWRAFDCCSNSVICTQVVTVLPSAPTLLCSNLTISCGSPIPTNPPAWIDPCCSNVTVTLLGSTVASNGCSQTIYQTWEAVDHCCGTSNICTQTVTVVNNLPPIVNVICVTNVYFAGGSNNFTSPVLSSPSSYLLARYAGTPFKQFDDCRIDTDFIDTFGNLPSGITSATLTMRLEPCGQGDDNDEVGLSFTGASGLLPGSWSKYIGSGNASPGLLTNTWDTSTYPTGLVFTLDLANLTTFTGEAVNLIPYLNQYGFLDFVCEDDTGVDYLLLTVVSCVCATNKTVECGSQWVFDVPSASDACSGTNVPATILNTVTNGPCPQVITRTWLFTDACDNTNTCSQTVTVVNTNPLVLTCVGDKTVYSGAPWSFDPPSVSAPCCSNLVPVPFFPPQTNGNCCRQIISQVWQVTDCCSNTATCTQTVTLICITPPTITCLPNKTVACGTNWAFDTPQASDACCPGNTLVPAVLYTSVTNVAPCTNVYACAWQATDACGHTATCTQTVTVAAPPPAPVNIVTTVIFPSGDVHISFPTEPCYNYTVEYTDGLLSKSWTTLAQVIGNGSVQTVVDPGPLANQRFYLVVAACQGTPAACGEMVSIPAGSFTMGDALDGESDALPLHTVSVSAFCMDSNLVSYTLWQQVYQWATTNRYSLWLAGSGKAANHPVQNIIWYDVLKWCNARSEMGGLTPCYYTDASQTTVYRTGQIDLQASFVNWSANGYRLPTEAEWEKAARGGLSGRRFPWGDTISESQANYFGDTTDYSYDLGPNGLNAAFDTGASPYTSPVGSFAPNGYGLYDMAGNVEEFCWDSYSSTYYSSSPGTDPRGPASSPDGYRVLRGGSWYYWASYSRCANRDDNGPAVGSYIYGFRCVKAH
jgi:formylglycine-generating enzyme required for sulfatase activity